MSIRCPNPDSNGAQEQLQIITEGELCHELRAALESQDPKNHVDLMKKARAKTTEFYSNRVNSSEMNPDKTQPPLPAMVVSGAAYVHCADLCARYWLNHIAFAGVLR
jgi:hypothetical protein